QLELDSFPSDASESSCCLSTSNRSRYSKFTGKEINHGRGDSYLHGCLCGVVLDRAKDLMLGKGSAVWKKFLRMTIYMEPGRLIPSFSIRDRNVLGFLPRKKLTKRGISSLRSRMGGTSTGKTLSQ